MDLKLNAGTPTYSWWKAKVDVCLMVLDENDPRVADLRKLWMGISSQLTSFLAEFLTIVEYPKSLFSCCDHPEIVSADGLYW